MSKEEDDDDKKPLDTLEPMRVVPLSRVAAFLGIHERTIYRNHADKIIRISPRRLGMRVRDALAIGEKAAKHAS
jgi:predicted DNA-binding transcriptional regulator AlpA